MKFVRASSPIATLLAGMLVLCPDPCQSGPKNAPPAVARPAVVTWKIPGRALDAEGRPVAGATVYLSREDGEADQFAEPIVIAQTLTQADGRFELTPLESEVKKELADPPAVFGVWVHKPGLALAENSLVGELPREPFLVLMQKESAVAICLRNPDGSPCAGATAAPIYMVHRGHRWLTLPKPLEAATQTLSAADGRIEVRGGHGDMMIVAIKTARFGIQNRTVQPVSGSPAIVKLCETRTLEGRLVLPKGEKVDLSKLTAALTIESWEKEPDKNASTHRCEPRGSSGAYDHFVVHPDREGRFTIANFPKGKHGLLWFDAFGPDEMGITTDQKPIVVSFDAPFGKPLKIEIPLRTGIWASAMVRDARTKRPLPDVYVAVEAHSGAFWWATSDKEGRLHFRLSPKEPYHVHCRLPAGYLRMQPGSEDDVVVPSGAVSYEMKPIELVSAATVEGDVLDLSGKPLAAVRIIGTQGEIGDPRPGKRPSSVSRWTTSDAAGRFKLENADGGTEISLVAVRDGIPIAGPIKTTAGDKPVRLNEKKCKQVSLTGHVLGLDRKPIAGGDIVIEVENSPDPTGAFRTTIDAEGKFETPARFANDLKYRVTVRSILVDVASSAWICPALSGNRFPDLVADRAKLALNRRLTGKEVVARVNGRPILASEILERAYMDPLPPQGISLYAASTPGSGILSDSAFRTLQETAIRKYVGGFIRTRLLTQALMTDADNEERKKIEAGVENMFEQYVEKLKTDMKAGCQQTLEAKLHRGGTSLASLKAEFRYHLLANEFERRAGKPKQEIGLMECFAYYQVHRKFYAEPEKVAWQMVEIQSEIPSARQPAKSAEAADVKRPSVPAFNLEFGNLNSVWDKSATAQPGGTSTAQNAGFDRPASEAANKQSGLDVVAYAEPFPLRINSRKARRLADEALSRLRKGESFESVAKACSNGPNADRGGWQVRISPDSIAEPGTAAALRQLPEGETSGVIETDNSFRIVRVVSRTPAGTKPFDEVEEPIRQAIVAESKKRALDELYSRTTVESPYIDDLSLVLRPSPPCSSEAATATSGTTAADDAFAP